MATDLIDADDNVVNEPAPIGFNRDSIRTSNKVWPIDALIISYKKKRLKTPSLQRKYEWKLDRQQAFIDSLLTNCPTPSLVFAVDNKNNGDLYILDGHQRTNTILRFMNDEFKTSSLNPDMPQCQDKYWSELDEVDKNWILNTELPILEVTTDRQFWWFIFRQINRGGLPLKPAAVWRAFHDVKILSALDSLADNSDTWLRVFGRNDGYRGLKTLVRAIAMHFAYNQFDGTMLQFLDKYCHNMRNVRYKTKVIVERLEKIFDALHLKVGKLAFRTHENKGPSPSLIDCVIHAGLLILQKNEKIPVATLGTLLGLIRNELVTNKSNLHLLTFQTSSKAAINARMKLVEELVAKHTSTKR